MPLTAPLVATELGPSTAAPRRIGDVPLSAPAKFAT